MPQQAAAEDTRGQCVSLLVLALAAIVMEKVTLSRRKQ